MPGEVMINPHTVTTIEMYMQWFCSIFYHRNIYCIVKVQELNLPILEMNKNYLKKKKISFIA